MLDAWAAGSQSALVPPPGRGGRRTLGVGLWGVGRAWWLWGWLGGGLRLRATLGAGRSKRLWLMGARLGVTRTLKGARETRKPDKRGKYRLISNANALVISDHRWQSNRQPKQYAMREIHLKAIYTERELCRKCIIARPELGKKLATKIPRVEMTRKMQNMHKSAQLALQVN